MYNEKMSKEECESESYSTCFLGVSASHNASHNMCHTSIDDKSMQFLVIYFRVVLLVNTYTQILICILFTVAHVSKLHATCIAELPPSLIFFYFVFPRCLAPRQATGRRG